MRIFLFIITAAALLGLAGLYAPAFSQRHAGYCDRTTSTAETLDCINRHKTDVQSRLNTTYKKLADTQDGAMKGLISAAQQAWIAYRDAQCAWEAGQAEAPALDRVYELSCITDLTETRTDMLSTLLHREQETDHTPREFSSNPRWMNVLSHDYQDIFWRYGQWLRTDLDCDGDNEQIMPGIAVKPATVDGEQDSDTLLNADIILAISENPVTGRPKTTIFKIPVSGQSTAPSFCSTAIDMIVTGLPEKNKATDNEKETSCKTAVQITDRTCPPILLSWTGDQYELSRPVPQPEKKPDSPYRESE